MIGLYKAVRDFRPDKETSFRSFAELCVTRQIITAIKTATRFKHAPLNTYVSFSHTPAGQESEGDCTLGDALPGPSVNDPSVCVDLDRGAAEPRLLPRHRALVARVGGAPSLPRGALVRGDGRGPRLRHEDDRQRAPAREAEDPRAPEDARSPRVEKAGGGTRTHGLAAYKARALPAELLRRAAHRVRGRGRGSELPRPGSRCDNRSMQPLSSDSAPSGSSPTAPATSLPAMSTPTARRRAGGGRARHRRRRAHVHRLRRRDRVPEHGPPPCRGRRGDQGAGRPLSAPVLHGRRRTSRSWTCASGSPSCRRAAGGEQRSILVNSGAEAVENAVKIARCGHRAAGGRRLRQRVPRPHAARDDDDEQGQAVQEGLRAVRARGVPGAGAVPVPRRLVRRRDRRRSSSSSRPTVDPATVACVVLEPVQGEGGFIPMPPDYPARLQELCRKHGILYVDDEVQAGVGRTGTDVGDRALRRRRAGHPRLRASRSAVAFRWPA